MEKKDQIDTELGIPSKNNEVVRGQGAVSAMMFSPTDHTKQPTSIVKI